MEATENGLKEKVHSVTASEITIPHEITNELVRILVADEKAGLLLRGFISGKEIRGNVTLMADFKLIIDNNKT